MSSILDYLIKVENEIPNSKKRKTYPAVKIRCFTKETISDI